jgi:hypothetical protein
MRLSAWVILKQSYGKKEQTHDRSLQKGEENFYPFFHRRDQKIRERRRLSATESSQRGSQGGEGSRHAYLCVGEWQSCSQEAVTRSLRPDDLILIDPVDNPILCSP